MHGTTLFKVAIVVSLAGNCALLPAQEKNLTILVKGNLTTRTSLFQNPNSPNPITRAQALDLTDFFGSGIEIKYLIPRSSLGFSISAYYLRFKQSSQIAVSHGPAVPVDDGYVAVPLDATGFFVIPASGQTVKLFIGGGVGVYFGKRQYAIAGVEAASTGTRPGFGIHVLAGVSYQLTDWFSLIGEMKFRDLQFHSTNSFQVSRIPYQGSFIPVGQAPFESPVESSVQTDGIVFQLGVGVSL